MPGKVAQVAEGAMRPEQQIHELRRGGEARRTLAPVAAGRAENFKIDVAALGYDPGLDESGQLARMVHMQMRQQHDVDLTQVHAGFPGADKRAGTGIHQYARFAVQRHNVAGAGAPRGARAAGTEHQQRQARFLDRAAAGIARKSGPVAQQQQRTKQDEPATQRRTKRATR